MEDKIGRLEKITLPETVLIPSTIIGALTVIKQGDVFFQPENGGNIKLTHETDISKLPDGRKRKFQIPPEYIKMKLFVVRHGGRNFVVRPTG